DELGGHRPGARGPGQDGGPDRALPTLDSEQLSQALLVEYRDAELLGLAELRAGAIAGDHVVGALRHRAGHLAAGPPDHRRRLLARQLSERAGEHERLPFQGAAMAAALGCRELESKAALPQPADQVQRSLV